MKTIVLYATHLPGGGVEQVINNLAKHYFDKDRILVRSFYSSGSDVNWSTEKVSHEVINICQSNNFYFEVFHRKRKLKKWINDDIKAVKPVKIIVLSTQLIWLFRSLKVDNLIFWPHHTLNPQLFYNKIICFLIRKWGIWAVNEDILYQFQSHNNVKLTYNPVDLDKLFLEANVKPVNEITLLAVGFFNKRKNFVQLITLLKDVTIPWKLHLFGDGEEYNSIVNTIARCGLEDRVKLFGVRPIFDSRNISYTAYISASYSEGFSMAMVEATLRGIPVLYSDKLSGVRVFQKLGVAHSYSLINSESLLEALNIVNRMESEEIREKVSNEFDKMSFLKRIMAEKRSKK